MTLFKNQYRVESARLGSWDCSTPGAYFVTICTKGRECWFSDIFDGKIRLSPAGQTVAEEWKKTEQVRPNVTLDQWIVMPNHLHGNVVINEKPGVETAQNEIRSAETTHIKQPLVETTRLVVSTSKILKPNSLGSIIG